MDNHSKKARSYNMSRIRSTNTKPEETVRKFIFSKGFRYRKNVRKLPGSPDIVLSKYRTAIFVNGCFWHMHEGCSRFAMPSSNQDYWRKKLVGNKERDKINIRKLISSGWNVIVVWECELKKDRADERLNALADEIVNQSSSQRAEETKLI